MLCKLWSKLNVELSAEAKAERLWKWLGVWFTTLISMSWLSKLIDGTMTCGDETLGWLTLLWSCPKQRCIHFEGLHLGLEDGQGTPLPSMLASQRAWDVSVWLADPSPNQRTAYWSYTRRKRCQLVTENLLFTWLFRQRVQANATLDTPTVPWCLGLEGCAWTRMGDASHGLIRRKELWPVVVNAGLPLVMTGSTVMANHGKLTVVTMVTTGGNRKRIADIPLGSHGPADLPSYWPAYYCSMSSTGSHH